MTASPYPDEDLEWLFEEANGVFHQSATGQAHGWRAIEELFVRFDRFPEWDEDEERCSELRVESLRETHEGRVFVFLQRKADELGIDVNYGLE